MALATQSQAITPKTLQEVKSIFDEIDEVVYLKNSPNAQGVFEGDSFELPVSQDGVNLNSGEPDITETKLTTQETWATKVKRGDSDFSFNVLSVNKTINDIFLDEIAAAKIPDVSKIGEYFKGMTVDASKSAAYSFSPKKVTGALLLVSQSKQTALLFPNIEAYATFNGPDDGPAYFACKVKMLADAQGAEFYVYELNAGA